MKTVILIPARFASTRYPGKPLVKLNLPDGSQKTLIQLSWEAARRINGVHSVYVVTDDDRIRIAAEAFGASVIMTSSSCENGTARCANALVQSNIEADLVINFQGDAPLTPPWFVEDLIVEMRKNATVQVATPVIQCDRLTYGHFLEDRRACRVGGTTVVFDRLRNALYFSKEIIPFIDPSKIPTNNIPVYHHVGVYAYRPSALKSYSDWSAGVLEKHEGLEQLRFLENGSSVRCVVVENRGRVHWELNNPEDVDRIESAFREN